MEHWPKNDEIKYSIRLHNPMLKVGSSGHLYFVNTTLLLS